MGALIVGIDLGTTNSLGVAARRHRSAGQEVIAGREGLQLTPSVVTQLRGRRPSGRRAKKEVRQAGRQ